MPFIMVSNLMLQQYIQVLVNIMSETTLIIHGTITISLVWWGKEISKMWFLNLIQ